MNRRTNVSPEQWGMAADLYELGFKSVQQLARDLGVSPQTVSREMKRRGAVKGSRARETVADLEALLDRRALRRAHAKAMAQIRVAQRRSAGLAAIDRMMNAIIGADALGDISLADEEIASTASAFGVRTPHRSSRR